jgi:nucleoid DNA-binding protein
VLLFLDLEVLSGTIFRPKLIKIPAHSFRRLSKYPLTETSIIMMVFSLDEYPGPPVLTARNLVEEFVLEVKRKLAKGDKVVFDNIGSFINNTEGNVQFDPDKHANYHLDSFGLESFQCLPLEGYDVRKRIINHAGKDPVKQASMRRILWRAAVIIPLLVAIVAVPLKTDLFKAKVESTTLNPLVSAEFEHNKNAVDQGINNESIKIAGNVTPAVKEDATIVAPTPAVEKSSYFVITGSFKSESNAIKQVEMLKEEGFTPEIVPASNGFFRVCAIACSDLNTALTKKDSVSKKFPDSWISRNR